MTYGRDTLFAAWFKETKGKTPEEIEAAARASGTQANKLRRAWRRYERAHEASKRFGFVGVGCISFAQARLAKFCERIGLQL